LRFITNFSMSDPSFVFVLLRHQEYNESYLVLWLHVYNS
jgi:hypothetical protein